MISAIANEMKQSPCYRGDCFASCYFVWNEWFTECAVMPSVVESLLRVSEYLEAIILILYSL